MGSAIKGVGKALGFVGTDVGPAVVNPWSDADRAITDRTIQRDMAIAKEANRQSQEARGAQSSLLKALNKQMAGKGPSLAQQQLRAATDRNIAQAAGTAASQRGLNPALAARLQQQMGAAANQQAASDSAQLRAAEALSAQQQVGGLTSQIRAQDLSRLATSRSSQIGQQQIGNKIGEDNRAAELRRQELQAKADQAQTDRLGKTLSSMGEMGGTMFGGGGGGEGGGGGDASSAAPALASAAMMFSDENNKKDIKPAKGKINNFLDGLEASSYKYKEKTKNNPQAGEGEHVSVMAQDLEKTKMGKQMVMDTKDGKVVDYGKGFGAILAAQVELNKRLKALEKGSK
jgi:hypothetical protein